MAIKELIKPDFAFKCIVDHEAESYDYADDLTELGAEIAKRLSHEWEDYGIGPYEYGSIRAVDVDMRPTLTDETVWVDMTGTDFIPVKVEGDYKGGGCDGEHRGRCRDCCREVEVPIVALVGQVKWQDGKMLVRYDCEPQQS